MLKFIVRRTVINLSLCSLGDSERRNQLYLQLIKFRFDIRKNFLDKRVMQ